MAQETEPIDPLESELNDLRDAERAGVFNATPIDTRSLLPQPVDLPPILLRLTRGQVLSAAAVLALAIGVWTFLFHIQLSEVRQQRIQAASHLHDATVTNYRVFQACFNGPHASRAGGCLNQDYDRDGDVDLADFRALQLTYADNTP